MALNTSSLILPTNTTTFVNLSREASIRGLSNFTFMAWFKVGPNSTKAPAQSAYVERQEVGGANSKVRFRFTPVQGMLQFGFTPKDGGTETSYTYRTRWDDRWHHAAFVGKITENNPTYQIFLDGVKVAEGSLVKGADDITEIVDTRPAAITIGNHARNGKVVASSAWEGSIDEIIILQEAASQSAISAYINSKDEWEKDEELADEDQPLRHYWKFDENSGTTTSDSASSLTGTLPATSRWTSDRPFIGNGATDNAAPSIPGTTAHHDITHDGFRASWRESTDNVFVQFYELYVSEFSNFSTYYTYNVGRNLSHQVTGLLPSVNYYWRVRAFDAARNASNYSTPRTITTSPMGDNTPPDPPRNLSASEISYFAFNLQFSPSSSSDVAGYKLDVSENAYFDDYISGYRNLDIGNQTQVIVDNLQPLTTYYVRLRAYDNVDNESIDGPVLRVNTLRQPDQTPPQIVELHEVTGLSARTVTLNWEEGVDNVGVSGYYVDISKNAGFTDFVSTQTQIWQHNNVGGVTRILVTGLEEETHYWFRVRAYDEAGNISDNQEIPGSFTTLPASIYEAGFITSQEVSDTFRVGPNPAVASTSDEPREFLVNSESSLYIEYDLSTVVGTIETATLQFIPKLKSWSTLGQIMIRIYPGDINSGFEGQYIYHTVLEEREIQLVDITSLLTSGSTLYTIEFSAVEGGFNGYIDTGWEVSGYPASPSGIPLVEVVADPNSSTQPLETTFNLISQERQNKQLNSDFEETSNGWAPVGAADLTTSPDSYSGISSIQVSGTTINSGINNSASSAQMPAVEAFKEYSVSAALKKKSGRSLYTMTLEATDNLGNAPSIIATKEIKLLDDWNIFRISGLIPQNKARLRLKITSTDSGDYTFLLDKVLVENTKNPGALFNGDSFGARWVNSAHNSISTIQGARFEAESPFLGDSNQNNSARAFIKNTKDSPAAWLESNEPVVVDRNLNKYSTYFGPSYGSVNLVMNPSFEDDEYMWVGGTRVDTESIFGDCSYFIEADQWAVYEGDISIESNKEYILQGHFKSKSGLVQLKADVYEISDSGNLSKTREILSEPFLVSDSGWARHTLSFTPTSEEDMVNISFTSTEETFIDGVQLTQSRVLPPYRDGSLPDGLWEGLPHRSHSGMSINGDESYIIMFEYEDEEGFFDAETSTTYQVNNIYTIPTPPDNVTNIQPLELQATHNSISVSAPYSGDDNQTNTARIEFRRSDRNTWEEVRPSYYRSDKVVRGRISGLTQGTNYQIRVIFRDPDGVYGAPLGIISGMVTTDYSKEAVEAPISISFGGFTLMGRDDKKIGVTFHDGFGLPDRRVNLEELPRQDGTTERQSYWGAKKINMSGFISGDTRADLDDVRTALVRALSPSQQRLVIDSLSQKGRFYYATCEGLKIDEDGSKNINHLEWSATFSCADPFAYSTSEEHIPTFTAPNNGEISLNNEGDAVVYPTITITTTHAYPLTLHINNTISGDSIRPKVTIRRGDRLIIDSAMKSITKNGVEVDYSGGFIRLPIGDNTLKFSLGATSGTPTIQASLRWRHKYL